MYFTLDSKSGSLEVGKDFPEEMTTGQAILLSIEKWQALATLVESGAYPKDGGADTCALCAKFWSVAVDPTACSNCPIMKATALPACDGTPYNAYNSARENHDSTGMLEAAHAEIQLLEELLGYYGEYIVRLGYGPLKGTIHVKRAYSKEDALEQIQGAFDLFNIDKTYYLGENKIIITFDHKRIDLDDMEAV